MSMYQSMDMRGNPRILTKKMGYVQDRRYELEASSFVVKFKAY